MYCDCSRALLTVSIDLYRSEYSSVSLSVTVVYVVAEQRLLHKGPIHHFYPRQRETTGQNHFASAEALGNTVAAWALLVDVGRVARSVQNYRYDMIRFYSSRCMISCFRVTSRTMWRAVYREHVHGAYQPITWNPALPSVSLYSSRNHSGPQRVLKSDGSCLRSLQRRVLDGLRRVGAGPSEINYEIKRGRKMGDPQCHTPPRGYLETHSGPHALRMRLPREWRKESARQRPWQEAKLVTVDVDNACGV